MTQVFVEPQVCSVRLDNATPATGSREVKCFSRFRVIFVDLAGSFGESCRWEVVAVACLWE